MYVLAYMLLYINTLIKFRSMIEYLQIYNHFWGGEQNFANLIDDKHRYDLMSYDWFHWILFITIIIAL